MLFSVAGYRPGFNQYDVTPNDQRLAMMFRIEAPARPELVLVQNFFEELKERVPN